VNGYNGAENYYGWWTMIASGSQFWSGGGDWNAITQFQSLDNSGGFIGLGINAADYNPAQLQIEGGPTGRRPLGAVQYDHWYHFVVHARWSTGASGLFELWQDGSKVLSVSGQTLKNVANPGMYYSQGFYSNRSSNVTVYQDGFCRAASYDAAAAC
jgi:hypothetical protein